LQFFSNFFLYLKADNVKKVVKDISRRSCIKKPLHEIMSGFFNQTKIFTKKIKRMMACRIENKNSPGKKK